LIDDINKRFIARYERTKLLKITPTWKEAIVRFFDRQKHVYLAIPLGFFIGSLGGIYQKYDATQLFLLAIKLTLLISSIFQLIVLIYSFKKIIQPLTTRNISASYSIFSEEVSMLYFEINKESQSANPTLDLAIGLTDMRKILFYNITLNAIMFCSMIFLLSTIIDFHVSLRITIIFFLVVLLIFSQIPYALGQNNMHNVLLGNKEGVEREELKEKINKYASLVPKFPFIISIISGFTAGGLLFYVIENLIKESIK
jgi:hypothetical protein